MNKAITDGLELMPPSFLNGLDVWSSGDGTPGSATYDSASNASLVAADGDFGVCLEVVKTASVQKLRYTGETPLLPGCYVRVTARVKAVAGNLPNLRIAAWAGGAGGAHVTGLPETGPLTSITSYGDVFEISAIIGSGTRTGVDMPWGREPLYAHVGLDLTGPTGGTLRIDDLIVEDATAAFHRTMMDWVDVRDFGALGDGSTDDSAAFEAADAAANGREIMVPEGLYRLTDHVTLNSPARFVGTVSMPVDKRLSLVKNFDLVSYIEAFGNEALAFRKAVQALFNFTDHDSLDMCGRKIDLTEPIDIQAALDNKDSFSIRRVIRNGQFSASDSTDWEDTVVTSQASYAASNANRLSSVTNVANIAVGSLVTGQGVGREVYVTSVNVSAGTVELSAGLYDAEGTQTYTFTRFKYLLDFSGLASLDKFALSDIEFQCNSRCSAIMIPPDGLTFHVRDCFITQPKDRGITSPGRGCQGMSIDRCQFLSSEQAEQVGDRSSIAINVNANDAKLRDNRVVRFLHFAVMGGSNYLIHNNHWFQGDTSNVGVRSAGIVLASQNAVTSITGNYIDNNFIEWTNEHDAEPDFTTGFSFSGLTVQNNLFFCTGVVPWFTFFVIKPYGAGHYVQGLNITGNVFRTANGAIERVERVDDTFASMDYGRFRNLAFRDNSFNGVDQMTVSPVMLQFDQNSDATTWTLNFADWLPFGGWVRNVESLVVENAVTTGSGAVLAAMPYVRVEQGSEKNQVQVVWPEACKGRVQITARVDNPN